MSAFSGKWTYADSNNLEALINATIPEERRKQVHINTTNHTMEFETDGSSITYTSTNPEAKKSVTFSPGQQFDFTLASGKTVQATWTPVGDNKGELKVVGAKGEGDFVLEASGTVLTMTMTAKGVTNVSKYNKA